MTAYLLLAAIAWAVAARGGTDLRDLVVVLVLVAAAAVVARARLPRDPLLVVALAALLAWLVILGPLRLGVSAETVRAPLLVVVATLTVMAVARLDAAHREVLVNGLVVLGCVHAVVVLGQVTVAVADQVPYPSRPDSLLGSATALGMLLVATSVLTARALARHGGWWFRAALLLQGAALVATGSRAAIVLAAALVVGYAARRPSRALRFAAVGVVLTGGAMVAWRLATEPVEQRPHLWRQALGRIAERPVLGSGPVPEAYEPSVPGARVTTHAHNELLQWAVDYGLVGLALGVLVVVLALRRRRGRTAGWGPGDRWLQVAALTLPAAALVDFTLRITAITVAAAALAALWATVAPSRLTDREEAPDRVAAAPGVRR